MHARQHRGSAGNGYRSSPAGLVVSGGHGSEHRSFNRSPSFGLPKPYQSPTLRRGDVFMEAGRLAAEYLVSQGLLPENALPMKWKTPVASSSSKKREGDLQGFRPQEAHEGRTSALARLGNFVPDAAAAASSGKRRFSDEYNSSGSRDQMKPRRRLGHSRSYDSNSNSGSSSSRLNGKRGHKAESLLDMEGDVHSASGNQEQWQAGRGLAESMVSELAPKTDAADLESKSESNQFPEVTAPEISADAHKDLPLVTDEDVSKLGDDSGALTTETRELMDDTTNDEVVKQCATESLPVQHCAVEGDQKMKSSADLKKLCRFVNVPTRTRSSLVHKVSKVVSLSITEADNTPDVKSQESAESVLDVPSVDGLTNPIQTSKCLDPDISRSLTIDSEEDIAKMSPAYPKEQDKCFASHSFPQGSMLHNHEGILEPPGFGRSTPIAERGDRQASNHNDTMGETKKSGEWLTPIITQNNEYNIHLSNLREKETGSPEERNLHLDNTVSVSDNDPAMDISLFPTGDNELCLEYAEEKQHFPSLFKICDLNLMQATNINKNRGSSDPNLIYPLNSETKSEAASADIHLSSNNSCNISDEHVGPSADGKEIEIIDLENGSPHEDKVLSNSETKEETVFTSVEGFPNNLQPSSGINDVHDGYGLMVSDFLGTDIADCSSVPPDFNSLHDDMSLHSGEVPALPPNMDIRDLFNINMSYMDTWDF